MMRQMSSAKLPPSAPPRATAGYSASAKVALQEGTARVQEMHQAIAGVSFDILGRIPLVSGPAGLIRQAHDAIAGSVYAAIHHGGGGLLDLADAIEQRTGHSDAPDRPPSRLANNLRSAINGAFGDHLADTRSVLAITLALYRDGRSVLLDSESLRLAWPQGGNKLCLFIHGLGCNEQCWEAAGDGIDIPHRLAADTGYVALTLRYNTGLPIDANGRQLSILLESLCAAWPQEIDELLIIGHSMGGLLARSALAHGTATGCSWPARLRKVICLGTPHLGSPIERLGQLATSALRLTNITEPMARVAARRSQGIQDLRHGPGPQDSASRIAWRFIGGSLSDDPESALGRLVGDGLVTPDSATAHDGSGDVLSVRFGGIGHMGLLNDARVYRQILAWTS